MRYSDTISIMYSYEYLYSTVLYSYEYLLYGIAILVPYRGRLQPNYSSPNYKYSSLVTSH